MKNIVTHLVAKSIAAKTKSLTLVTLFLTLAACSSSNQQTLADLKYKPPVQQEAAVDTLSRKEIREEYQELLSLFKEGELKEQIERRIADVYMLEGGEAQLKSTPQKSYYADAIKNYQTILKKYPNSPDNADVLYQLARAFDMEGNQDKALEMLTQLTRYHPNYAQNGEARFRMGDIYFSREKYREAEKQFVIVGQYRDPKLLLYARYMLGWSHYKQMDFEQSLIAFTDVLNQLIAKSKTAESLSKAEKPLVDDTLHSMSLGLAQSGGAETIETLMALQGKAHIWMVYSNLGEYYLAKERYEDSAHTYRLYVKKYNYSAKAPELHHRLIETYIKGGFPLQALQEKESYVDYYGLDSDYVANVGGLKADIKSYLKTYIEELAQHYHNTGQNSQKSLAKLSKISTADSAGQKRKKELSAKELASFNRAAHFYSEFLRTFPSDPKMAEMTYLRAEVLFQAKRFAEAITDYEAVAYQFEPSKTQNNAANAGYAAIISYQKLLDNLEQKLGKTQAESDWQAKAVESMLRFANKFHQDKRSPTVLTNAAEYLFALEQYERALTVGDQLLANKQLDPQLKKTAFGIMAHSNFKLERYQAAEDNYFKQRQLTAKSSAEYSAISERLATAIYKKSEQLIAADNNDVAINELLKITQLAPDSKVRVTAQYDATRLLLNAKRWSEAIVQLKQLIILFPKNANHQDYKRKLAFAFEQNKQWSLAAAHYLALSQSDPDADIKRESLFQAAAMFRNNKEHEIAIGHFKTYARTFEQPFAMRMEARFNLAELYLLTKEESKHLFWLRRIIEGDAKGGKHRNARSQWLGAWANVKYGDSFAKEFKRLKLRLPLAKSLPKKNAALKNAIERYQQAAAYGIFEFVTMTSLKTADLYHSLVNSLRNSANPKGFSAEEVVAYREIIEEQALPLMDTVVELHMGNVERAWQGEFDEWIDKSFKAMAKLYPARFDKVEAIVSYGDEIW